MLESLFYLGFKSAAQRTTQNGECLWLILLYFFRNSFVTLKAAIFNRGFIEPKVPQEYVQSENLRYYYIHILFY